MPIEVVTDAPGRIVLRAPRHAIRLVLGGTLVTVGVLASAPLVVFSFLAAAVAFGSKAESLPLAKGQIVEIWAITLATVILGTSLGFRLLRGRRRLALFLRRFGFDDATAEMSYAVASAIGPSWRLVTLDDARIAPLGISDTAQRVLHLVGVGAWVGRRGRALLGLSWLLMQGMFVAMWLIVIVGAIGRPSFPESLLASAVGYIKPVLETVQAGRPVPPLGLNLQSAFLVMALLETAFLFVGIVAMPLVFLVIPLAFPIAYVSMSLSSMRAAEAGTQQVITDPKQLDVAAWQLARTSRRVVAPRLVVMRVASRLWRDAVKRLAMVSSAVLIDISRPSENLLWEIDSLKATLGSRFVVIGELGDVDRLTDPGTSTWTDVDRRLVSALDGQRVLAYTTDQAGRRRFARALRDRLETLPRADHVRRYPRPQS